MSEENKEIVRRSFEEITAGDIGAIDKFFASDLVYHGTGGMQIQGTDGLKEMISMYLSAFSELKTEIHTLLCLIFLIGPVRYSGAAHLR